ncbi:MAG: V-type ATP synthase subunit I, partial [Treponema sp.]|nr:V-type ATP synthase subunit I [Treponema sp.]
MKKVSLVVQNRHKDVALARLRDVGVMHIEMSKAPSERLSEIVERRTRTENALALIKPFKVPQKKDEKSSAGRRASDSTGNEELEPYSAAAVNTPGRPDLVELMLKMGEDRGKLEEQYALLARERGRIAPWGEFDPGDMEFLALRGVFVYLYELGHETFRNIPKETRFVKIGETKSMVYLMVLDAKIPDVQPFRIPEKTLSQVDADLKETKDKLDALNERIKSFVTRRPVLERTLADVQQDFDFERARTELEKVDGVPTELGISYITGYVPSAELGRLKSAAQENCWALAADDPTMEDAPPTKLKNNVFTKQVSPLTGFLELLPGYHERDVSGWFLVFVTIFFGMILGDAAYGLIFFLIAVIGMAKTAKKGVPLGLRMLLIFSLGNIVWGTVTASWFAINYWYLPSFLVNLSVPLLTTAALERGAGTPQHIVAQNMQVFCFSLALVHLGIARLGSIVKRMFSRDLRWLADLGSIGMLVGMYNVILFLVVNAPERGGLFELQTNAMYILAGGFALSFLFSYYERNLVQSILGSLQNIFPVVLGVTGIFSDIMSYVRLWAVGMAGFALAAAFNGMAGPMLGSFLVFAGALVLIMGHGLNLVLNTLSVLVHGVRLNILEFSGHAGLTWSGIPYKPFAEAK